MLTINNQDDIKRMMEYHRTRDMINLIIYFGDLSPIKNLTIVESIEDYNNNYDYCKNLPCLRNDTVISKPSMKSVEVKEKDNNIEEIFKKVKEIDDEGVLVLFDLCHKPSERYERYAGISVGVSIGEGIHIDAVGKGFDGREVSKGLITHERYYIPWFELRKCSIENFKDYRTYIITDEEYKISREERINFLLSVGLDKEIVSKHIPEKYSEIPEFIWLSVITKIIKQIEEIEEELRMAGFEEFAISGHTEGEEFLPWQMYDKSRYVTSK